jgi:hypothetical protein
MVLRYAFDLDLCNTAVQFFCEIDEFYILLTIVLQAAAQRACGLKMSF